MFVVRSTSQGVFRLRVTDLVSDNECRNALVTLLCGDRQISMRARQYLPRHGDEQEI